MSEAKKVFFEDIKDKSITARSARASGRKSGKGNNYTDKEIAQMAGPSYSININEYIPFKEFKKLPEGLQREYLTHIIEKWHVGSTGIAKMWGVTDGTTCPILKRLGIERKFRASPKDTERFLRKFVKKQLPESDLTSKQVEQPQMRFCDCSLSFIGIPDLPQIVNAVGAIVPKNKNVKITLLIEAAE